eukprot:g259.t1
MSRLTSNKLLVTSWDASVQLHDADTNRIVSKYEHKAPVLDACFVDDDRVISGGLDCGVTMHDFNSGNEDVIGTHEKAVRCLEFSELTGLVVSGSWDCTVKLWDLREKKPLVATMKQPGKVFTMSMSGNRLVVGTSGNHVYVWDLRKPETPSQKRTSSLKHMTRVIRSSPDGAGFAMGSVEGRVAVEYFDPEAQKKKYAFKCHRKTEGEGTIIYPVNALAFHPKYGTFASGGCDGGVCIWDGANKKRLCQLAKHPVGIAALAFNRDGTILAAASSYTFEEGEKGESIGDNVYLHSIQESQVKPKPKKKKKRKAT